MTARGPLLSGGFSLVELVVAIAALAVAMTVLVVLLLPRADQGAQLLWQVRGAELAGRILDELGQYPFDEHSSLGSRVRCGEKGTLCTPVSALGADGGESLPALYDDLDDFDGFSGPANTLLDDLPADYGAVQVRLRVFYDADNDGLADAAPGRHKRIQLELALPQGERLAFARYRSNY